MRYTASARLWLSLQVEQLRHALQSTGEWATAAVAQVQRSAALCPFGAVQPQRFALVDGTVLYGAASYRLALSATAAAAVSAHAVVCRVTNRTQSRRRPSPN